jgi:hypothetical protein
MNLPSGKIIKKELDNASTDTLKLLAELARSQFSGYIALCVKATSLEEGTLLMDKGKIVGAMYEYYALKKEFAGEQAFTRFLNASAAKQGILDVIQLTPEQVHLALAFNENSVFVPKSDVLRHSQIKEFSPFFEQQAKNETEKIEKKDAPERKYNMYALTKETPATHLPQRPEEQHE